MLSRITNQLILREYAPSDVDALFKIQGDRDYMQFTCWSASRQMCESWLQQYVEAELEVGFAPWTVVHRLDQRIVGWGGLNIDLNAQSWGPEVSYFIDPAYQRAGLATELVLASLHYGFRDLGLPAIGAFVRPGNLASIRVLTKCGFELVGYEPALERSHYAVRRDAADRANQ